MNDDGRWWLAPKTEDGAQMVCRVFDGLWDQINRSNTDRRLDLQCMRSMYLDQPSDRYESWAFHRTRGSRYNLTTGAIDATHAQIVASRPRPKIITVGQDAAAQRKAVLRQRWLDGEYERLKVYERLSEMALDGLISGTGCLKVAEEDGRNVIDRVWVGDLWVDPREERYHRVRTLYQLHAIDREVLADAYPDQEKAIERLPGMSNKRDAFIDLEVDGGWENPHQIGVIEAWRLPISRDKPGRHVIVAPGGDSGAGLVLLDEEWDHPGFPFVFFHWAPDPQRFWGQGMVERAAGMQSDLNEITEIIQGTYQRMVPQLWVDDAAMVQGNDIDDRIGGINHCKPVDGNVRNAVVLFSPDVGPGLMNREAEIAGRFLPVLGVDALGATAEKPAGLNSGIALQEYHDQTSQRFLPAGRRYEQTTVDLADLLFHFADKLAAKGHDQSVRAYGKSIGLQLIRYEQIKPSDEDEIFEVRVKPGSALPKDPAGRIQTVLDMQAMGLQISAEEILELIEMPDTESMSDKMLVSRRLITMAIERCAMDPKDEPQPQANGFWDRTIAMTEITNAIQMGEYNGESEETMARLRNLHGQLRSMPDPNAPPEAPMGPEGMPPPTGAMPDPAMGADVLPMPPPPGAPPMVMP